MLIMTFISGRWEKSQLIDCNIPEILVLGKAAEAAAATAAPTSSHNRDLDGCAWWALHWSLL